MRARLSAAVALGLLIGLAALLAPSASAESSPSAYASRLVSLINQARAQHGLKALTVTSGTSTVATNWTNHLDQQQALSHNPDLGHQLETHGSPNWTAYGENVGDGPTSSADTLFQAYMNSPEHRDNILGSAYRYLGIGVVFDGSTAWNTLDFVDQYSSSTSSTGSTTTTTSHPRTATTHSSTKPAPVKATAPVRQHTAVVRHVAPRPAPAKATQRVQVRAVASKAPTASAATVTAAAPAAPAQLVASIPSPQKLVHTGRNTTPIIAAAALVLLVVATRYAAEVLPRAAVTTARAAR